MVGGGGKADSRKGRVAGGGGQHYLLEAYENETMFLSNDNCFERGNQNTSLKWNAHESE